VSLLVDGNNVIGTRPDGWWRDRPGATRRLVDRLAAWADGADEDVVVVFDGAPLDDLEPARGVDVRFAPRRGPNAADDVIADLVAAAPDPGSLRVVTSDAGLAGRVRARGAAVSGAGAFRDELDRA
jgi:predicted RNA-binding protein with PIN domain